MEEGSADQREIAAAIAAVGRIPVVPNILEVVCRTTGMRFAAVARVTEDRWVACAVRDEIAFGLEPGGELEIETTICNEIRLSGQLVVIDHVTQNDRFREHPTPKRYGFESYISVPIRLSDGRFFGTLCAIDPRPASLESSQAVHMFELFANLIAFHLEAQDRVIRTETALLDERQQRDLQQQFIAVLGHDLRNPLSSIRTGIRLLQMGALDEQRVRVAEVIDQSVGRMTELIENVLDLARGRLGGGLPADLRLETDLQPILEYVVAEMRTARSDRLIQSELAISHPVKCDRSRLAQLLSNLLSNAVIHGDPSGPVWVRAHSDADGFELSVTNLGPPIAASTRDRLFQPFTRGADAPNRAGLGLGLYIADQIARAHHGRLEVTSTADETRFTFRLPAT